MTASRRAGDLAGPGVRAVVVGTGAHTGASGLAALPSVETTVRDLARALHEVCGMDPAQIELILDPADDGQVIEAVERAAAGARGPVLFVFVGHGLLGPQDQLYLATSASAAGSVARSASYRVIRDTLSDSGTRAVVVLDCCFSGLAETASTGSARDPYAGARPDGSFLLTSASLYEVAFAPPDEPHTLFTGKLLRLLREGDPSAPAWLTLDGAYAHLDRVFQDGPARPHRQSEGRVGETVIAANPAYPSPAASLPAPVHPADGTTCPYPGMEAFRAEDHRRFFGREPLVEDLLDEVSGAGRPAEGGGPPPLVLVGASGVGKSSILRAGLLAGLERRYEADPSTAWPPLLLPAPGPHPLLALADLWSRASGRPRAAIEQELAAGHLPDDGTCRVLVVDQFEEVFTRCRDAAERDRFLRALCPDAATGPHGQAGAPRVVLGLRADHYGSCLEHPALRPALRTLHNVWPMDEAGLRAAITRPAHDAGLRLEAGLVDVLLQDTREGGGHDHGSALPFLAHALRETWVRRRGATLTLAGYAATGGIWQSVARTAEAIHQELDAPGRTALRELLLGMVTLTGGGEEAVRRRIALDELLADRTEAQRDTALAVRDRLAGARLVTMDRDTAQISHEALLRAWPRLRNWIEEDRAALVTRQQLTDAAHAWDLAGRSPEYCYRGARLAAASEWYAGQSHNRLVGPREREFLAASEQLASEERDRERAQLAAEQRRTHRLRLLLGATGALLCLALIAAGLALQQRAHARANGEQAQDRQLQAAARADVATDPRAALLLAVAAHREHPTPQSRATLMDVLARTQYEGSLSTFGWVDSLSYSDNGRTLAVGQFDGAVSLWDTSKGGDPSRLAEVVAHTKSFFGNPAVWIGDGSSLLLTGADSDRSLGRFSLADRSRPRPGGRHALPMRGLLEESAFSPDGRMLVTSTVGETVLWSLAPGDGTPRLRARLPQRRSNVQAAAFGPGADLLVLGWQDGTVDLWHTSDPGHPRRLGALQGTGDAVRALCLGRDGTVLAVATEDSQVRLWDVTRATGDRPTAVTAGPAAVISGHAGPVRALALSRDGRRLALGSTDQTATVWDVSRIRPVRTAVLSGHAAPVTAVTFTPDGSTLVTGDPSGSVRFWSLTDRLTPVIAGRPLTLAAPDYYRYFETAVPYALAADGSTLALATKKHELSLVALTGARAGRRTGTVRTDPPGSFSYEGIWLSPDRSRLAAEGPRGTLTVWNVRDPARPAVESRLRAGPADASLPLEVAFRGAVMAVGSQGAATLWDLSQKGRPRRAGTVKMATDIATPVVLPAPRGSVLAVDRFLYDVTVPGHPKRLAELPAPDGGDLASAQPRTFSSDGRLLVVGRYGADGGLLYDVSAPERPVYLGALPQSNREGPYVFGGDDTFVIGPGSGTQLLYWDVREPGDAHIVASATLAKAPGALGLSPDGTKLTTYNLPGESIVWNISRLAATLRDPVARACRLAAGNPTIKEWRTIAPGVPFRKVCPALAPAPSPPPPGSAPYFPSLPTPLPAG
ncbi:hypothetical protein [Streptomyces sp. NPDC089919]|uniref:caspase, EACC1-associated type n=1 Tax=Streptomyces sp. NPDC089919 TaxID=3155188 RepID=UPI003449B4BE